MRPEKPFCIGIIGGMGPRATVHFQNLLLEATGEKTDQEYPPFICASASRLPDRSRLLAEGRGEELAQRLAEIGRKLEDAGATVLVMPCLTAHAVWPSLQPLLKIPLLDLAALTARDLLTRDPPLHRIGVLATTATLRERVFERHFTGVNPRQVMAVTDVFQTEIMNLIFGIKGGYKAWHGDRLRALADQMRASGAKAIILGCTELSLATEMMRGLGVPIFDPLRIAAAELVRQFRSTFYSCSGPVP
ncbi:amino acid racemase [Candidatus Uhrbacteria bacterium]|nr:amino acid racemase [Candidatus Uhrbacteria bacterium]